MGIQLMGVDGSTLAEVDSQHKSQRVSIRPLQCLAWSSFGVATGVLPTGTAAGAALFSLRNTGANLLVVRRLTIGFAIATAFTAAQRLEFALSVARGWSTSDSGGTALTATSGRHKATLAALSCEARVAATAGLTAGTRALDPNAIAMVAGGVGALGTSIPMTAMFSHDTGDYPLLLGNNEGIVVSNALAFGAAGSGVAYVNLEVAEAAVAAWIGS